MTADLRQRLETSLGNGFTLTRELGGGGMSRVFLATDTTLQREVVIKVLSDELTGAVSSDRFRREIQVIAKLQHPHVVPLLSAGSADGALYYIMPFRGGETLRARIGREGRLAIAETVRILRNVLDALAFAHAHGVIHRDIKPENILIEAGHAVVADFGVSKALRDSSSLTSVGVALGTPMYMAPEQAAADPDTDHRADLYAVGIVAYEMLAGAPPFTGSPQQVFRAHMMEEPAPLRERRADVPEALALLVMQSLRKEPARRPVSALEMLGQLEDVETPRRGTSAFEVARRRNPLKWMGVAAAVVLLAAIAAWRLTRPQVIPSAQSLAIAPFSVASGDTALVRLGQNLVSTISASVDGVGEVRVADPMTVLSHARSKGHLLSASDAAAIARKLGARSVLTGTLAPAGAAVQVNAVLQEADGGGNVIARFTVTAPADSLAVLTDSLTWSVLRAIWGRGRPPTPNVASITTRSPAALREFLEGERLFSRGEALRAAAAYLRAVNIDTTFWFAHIRYRTARGWWLLPADTAVMNRLRRNRAKLPPRDSEWLMAFEGIATISERQAANRAFLARHPDYLPARVTLADYSLHHAIRAGHDVREAPPLWQEIVQLVPGDQEMSGHLVWACIAAGDIECARRSFAHLDSLVRADSAPAPGSLWSQRTFGLTLAANPTRFMDSLARQIADGDSLSPHGNAWTLAYYAPLSSAIPDLPKRWEMSMTAGRPAIERLNSAAAYEYFMLYGRMIRGDWSGIDSAIAVRPAARFHPANPVTERESWRARVAGEALGLIEPSPRTAAWALSRGSGPGTTTGERQEARWMAAVNSRLRGDSTGFAANVRALAADSGAQARIALRSLHALSNGWAGNRAAAAESLLVLERDHGERAIKVYAAFMVNRMFAARWLLEAGKAAAADSLLRFTQGWALSGSAESSIPVFALAMLQRSRIAEALGNRSDAVAFASVFVSTWDLAPASQRPLIEEAKQRISRLSPSDVRR